MSFTLTSSFPYFGLRDHWKYLRHNLIEIQTSCQILLKRAQPICGIDDIGLTWLEIPQGQRPHLLCSHHVPASGPVLATDKYSTNIFPMKVKFPVPRVFPPTAVSTKGSKDVCLCLFLLSHRDNCACTWTQKTPEWKLEFWLMLSFNSEQIKE